MTARRSIRVPQALTRERAASLAASPVIRGTAFLYGSTITTSVLGFFFWFVAARLLTPEEVGAGSAAQSAAQLCATIGILGLGTLTIAELATDRSKVRQLVSATCLVAAIASTAAGVVTGVVLTHTSRHLDAVVGGWLPLTTFALLAGTTAAGLVLDDACIGLLRGEIQLVRNAVFAAAKLALLPVAIYAGGFGHGRQIIVVWLLASAGSLVVAYGLIRRRTEPATWRPDLSNLIAKRRLIWSHHLLNVAVLAPGLAAPVVVTTLVGPSANAGFYTALLVTNFVNIIPSQLATTFFALAPGDEAALAREIRITLRVSVAVSVAAAVLFGFGSHLILHVFRRSYVSAAPAMALLGFATFPYAIKSHFVGITRVQGRMQRGAAFAALAAIIEIVGAVIGTSLDNVTGAAAGLLTALVFESLLFGPTVLSALRGQQPSAST
ncbi:MAG TPA: hypothetical protein VG650_08715 [Mycobacteriales bacterium]|nr:hypothetical protein [Mycobacteriales bacterium]